MKKIELLIIALLFIAINACDDSILNEKPLDFYSPENSYVDPEGIKSALNYLYAEVRVFYNGSNSSRGINHWTGTDFATSGRNPENEFLGNYTAEMTPSGSIPRYYWSTMYKIIFNANVVLNRIENAVYNDQSEKDRDIAEALFFRGYAYRHLVHLFGGVPLVLEEISSPKRDFVRASKEEVLQQAISDLEIAADNLPGVEEVEAPGRVNNAAALHLLAELYISAGELDKSINAATAVIDDPDIQLMTTRFGNFTDEEGDPYWDLFQRNNPNRGNGNKEGIWVLQSELVIPGGYSPPTNKGSGLDYERALGPLYWFIEDPDGVRIGLEWFTTQQGGQGYGYVRPTSYFIHNVWGNGNWDKDLRNNPRNMKRDFEVINPESEWYGKTTADFPQSWYDALGKVDTMQNFFPRITKTTLINHHDPIDIKDPETGVLNNIRWLRNDWYLMRVAETYLLRAEAKLGKGDKIGAAADINMVRNRVQAIPVTPDEVDIDYILDERMRELNYEENRRNTLARLGLLYDRVKRYNDYAGTNIEPYNNLMPIPYTEIERNTEAVLEQNPGYTN